jgi:hypothetical protein
MTTIDAASASNPYQTNVLYSPINPSASGQFTISSPFTAYSSAMGCMQQSTLTVQGGQTGILDSACEMWGLYDPILNGNYACLRCADGKTGTINIGSDNQPSYLTNCVADSDFSTSVAYTGFNTEAGILNTWGSIRNLFSAYACTDAAQTPVAFIGLRTTMPAQVNAWYHWNDKSQAAALAQTCSTLLACGVAVKLASKNLKCLDVLDTTTMTANYLTTDQAATGSGPIDNCGSVRSEHRPERRHLSRRQQLLNSCTGMPGLQAWLQADLLCLHSQWQRLDVHLQLHGHRQLPDGQGALVQHVLHLSVRLGNGSQLPEPDRLVHLPANDCYCQLFCVAIQFCLRVVFTWTPSQPGRPYMHRSVGSWPVSELDPRR